MYKKKLKNSFTATTNGNQVGIDRFSFDVLIPNCLKKSYQTKIVVTTTVQLRISLTSQTYFGYKKTMEIMANSAMLQSTSDADIT